MRRYIFLVLLFLVAPIGASAAAPPPVQDVFFRAVVTDVLMEDQSQDEYDPFFRQDIRAKIQSEPEAGNTVSAAYETRLSGGESQKLKVGDRVLLGKQTLPGEEPLYYVGDHYRLPSLVWFLIMFIGAAILCAGWRGALAFIGIPINLCIILFFILPQIIAGRNPLLICILGAIAIAIGSFFLGHGFHRPIMVAFASTMLMIIATVCLSAFFVGWAKLFGIGTEEAFYLQYAPIPLASFRGLLIGGIIIGALGVLDDVTTAQAAAVEEIHRANPALSFSELYQRAMAIGREHIISVINTLVLAYAGASLPLLLLFRIYEQPAWVTLNSEMLMEEIVRTLAGSIALIFAVPLTCAMAAFVMTRKKA